MERASSVKYFFKNYILISGFTLSFIPCVQAIETLTFQIAELSANEWSLKNLTLSLNQLTKIPQLSLDSATLTLPAPLQHVSSLAIHCQTFVWGTNYLNCSKGQGAFKSSQSKQHTFSFSLNVKDGKSYFNLSHLRFLGGIITVEAQETPKQWHIQLKGKGVDLQQLKAWLEWDGEFELTQGSANIDLSLSGMGENLQSVELFVSINSLSAHHQSGNIVGEKLGLEIQLKTFKDGDDWRWQQTSQLLRGGLYVDPIYLDMDQHAPLSFASKGRWRPKQHSLDINELTFIHPDVFTVEGDIQLGYQAKRQIKKADISVYISDLKTVTPVYLLPFLESSLLAELHLTGEITAQFSIEKDEIIDAKVQINHLGLKDIGTDIALKGANAQIHWRKQQDEVDASFINWQQLNIQSIPFQLGQLDFITYGKQGQLLKVADLAVLGGVLSIQQFSFAANQNNTDAMVNFEGGIQNISLKQLSSVLDWTPLSGTISGHIPSIKYQDKKLSLNGELKMHVFDGEITIKNLASEGLFTDFWQFYSDIEFDHLDLDAITHQFDMGYVEGRLSGSVKKLYLENWQPVSFYAWLGTPKDDYSTHKISQKAVENIASIGGGGISDILSRGVLGLFNDFGYSQLGFGCYLYQGVCQIMGVEAVDNGFYLIKGGGLPRVDVIGYNPRVDWATLINRLSRISTSDEVIIE